MTRTTWPLWPFLAPLGLALLSAALIEALRRAEKGSAAWNDAADVG